MSVQEERLKCQLIIVEYLNNNKDLTKYIECNDLNTETIIEEILEEKTDYFKKLKEDPTFKNYFEFYIENNIQSGLVESSIRNNKNKVRALEKFLEKNYQEVIQDLNNIDVKHIKEFLINRPNTKDILNSSLVNVLHSFFNLLIKKQVFYRNPIAVVKNTLENDLFIGDIEYKEHLTLENIKSINNYFSSKEDKLSELRDRAIFFLMMDTACSRQEICLLKRGDIDFRENYVTFYKSKSKNKRSLKIGKMTSLALEEYSRYLNRYRHKRTRFFRKLSLGYGEINEDCVRKLYNRISRDTKIKVNPSIIETTVVLESLSNNLSFENIAYRIGISVSSFKKKYHFDINKYKNNSIVDNLLGGVSYEIYKDKSNK